MLRFALDERFNLHSVGSVLRHAHMNTLADLLSSRVKAEVFRLLFGTVDQELHVRGSNAGRVSPTRRFARSLST